MNHYSIYWIEKEFASHYFYRSDILYRFIRDYQINNDRADLHNQFEFVTKEFSFPSLISHINEYAGRFDAINVKTDDNFLQIWNTRRYISLHIDKKRINFRSELILDAEELLFPALRSCYPHLFIVGDSSANYGWISPVVHREEDVVRQALYSYL